MSAPEQRQPHPSQQHAQARDLRGDGELISADHSDNMDETVRVLLSSIDLALPRRVVDGGIDPPALRGHR
jgi:hypothetical protein